MTSIAIVGMGCLFPGAPDIDRFWSNIRDGVDAISQVPPNRWGSIFYDPVSSAVDRFYCNRGGFVDDHAEFDPLPFGVLPKVLSATDPEQLFTLKVGIDALRDAGYDNLEMVPRERTGVVIGKGGYPNAAAQKLQQHVSILPQLLVSLRDLLPNLSEDMLEAVRSKVQGQLTEFGPDAAAGIVPNLVASRLANRLDLHGPAYVVDAACASFMIALQHAVSALRHDEADLMLVGAVHLCHDPSLWATFCQLGAMSRAGMIKPFSNSADGTLAGEGVAAMAVKRLGDAVDTGDRIYAVIEGVGASSDGRSTALLAPSSEGQRIAVERAWKGVPFPRSAVGLVEAHGTATVAGDMAELKTVAACFGPHNGRRRGVIGSVKSMIGHAMPAAGAAATIKAALAIYHGVLPPSLHCPDPHPALAATRFRIAGAAEPWEQSPQDRVAAVNAFGFGGINGHAVMRGYVPRASQASSAPIVRVPAVLTLHAETVDALLAQLDACDHDSQPKLGGSGPVRLAILEPDARKLALARKIIMAGKPHRGRQQIFFSADGLAANGGKVAFLFPGIDGIFYPRGADLARRFKLALPKHGEVATPMSFSHDTMLGVVAFNAFMFDVLRRLSITPDVIAGHSLGEFNALVASGVLKGVDDVRDLIHTASSQFPADVTFLAAACDAATLEKAIDGLSGVHLTHDNCPGQAVACGRSAGLETLRERLRERKILCQKLPFAGGFHSPYLRVELEHGLDTTAGRSFSAPEIPIWSGATATPYPADEEGARATAIAFQLHPVRFRSLVENLYRDGQRIFIQVGTGTITGLVGDTLRRHPHLAMAANHSSRSGIEQLTQLSAALWVEGVPHDTILLQPPRSDGRQLPRSVSNVRLDLGVTMFRLGPLEGAASSQADVSPCRPVRTTDDPVERALQDTLQEIEDARREVVDILGKRRAAASPVSDASEIKSLDLTVTRRLDLETTIPYVTDHELYPQRRGWPVVADRHPVVPLTMEIDLIREVAEASLPNMKVIEFMNVQAYRWLAVAEPVDINIQLRSRTDGRIDVEIENYFRAEISMAAEYPLPPTQLPALADPRRARIDAKALYEEGGMFHGPAYRGISSLDAVGTNGVNVSIRTPTGKGSLVDNMGQAAAYWLQEQEGGSIAMPVGLRRLRLFGDPPPPGSVFSCHSRVNSANIADCYFNIRLNDPQGRVLVDIEDWHTRRYPFDHDMMKRIRRPQVEGVSTPMEEGVVLFHDVYDSALARDMLARTYLSTPEFETYERMVPRRRRQWLNGRCAAKDAVLHMLRRTGHQGIFPKEMRIENDKAGRPCVIPNVTHSVPHGIHVSLTHKGRMAAAIAAYVPVGIDLEEDMVREAGFAGMIAGPDELGLLDPHGSSISVNRIWVAKEAAAKAAGTGLTGNPKGWIIQSRIGDSLRVNGRWVRTRQLGMHVIGWTALDTVVDDCSDADAPTSERRII